jgi:hypothetical protein
MLNISPYGLPGRIGASAAAGGAVVVTGFPVGAGRVPFENGHQENDGADPDQDQRNMPEASVIRATTKDDARDGGRQLSATIPAARETWLSSVIGTLLDADEQQTLLKAATIIERIADSHP